MLKDKLVDSGPEVVKKISEEKDKAESRLRSAHRAVSELEAAVVEVQGQLERATEDTIKVHACISCFELQLRNYY